MAVGVFITYKILDIADLTVDGSICTGMAVCAVLMTNGVNVWVAMLCSLIAGMLTGLVTGIFHTFMGIPAILAGILTQLILWSVNLKILWRKPCPACTHLRCSCNVAAQGKLDIYSYCFCGCSCGSALLVFRYGVRFCRARHGK